MTLAHKIAALFIMTLCGFASPYAEANQLLSFQDFNIRRGQYISRFKVNTYGIRVIAVCRVPRGWGISVLQDASPIGLLTGYAGHGVAYMDFADVHRLQNLFLTDEPSEIVFDRHDFQPPTFSGRICVGTYGVDRDCAWRRMKRSNYALAPAERCQDLPALPSDETSPP